MQIDAEVLTELGGDRPSATAEVASNQRPALREWDGVVPADYVCGVVGVLGPA